MTNENGVKVLTDMVADFVAHIGKKLPDDVVAKLEELGSQETAALPKALYETMTKNQKLAVELNRPSCQDTGVLQFWLKCGTNFPYINELEGVRVNMETDLIGKYVQRMLSAWQGGAAATGHAASGSGGGGALTVEFLKEHGF